MLILVALYMELICPFMNQHPNLLGAHLFASEHLSRLLCEARKYIMEYNKQIHLRGFALLKRIMMAWETNFEEAEENLWKNPTRFFIAYAITDQSRRLLWKLWRKVFFHLRAFAVLHIRHYKRGEGAGGPSNRHHTRPLLLYISIYRREKWLLLLLRWARMSLKFPSEIAWKEQLVGTLAPISCYTHSKSQKVASRFLNHRQM